MGMRTMPLVCSIISGKSSVASARALKPDSEVSTSDAQKSDFARSRNSYLFDYNPPEAMSNKDNRKIVIFLIGVGTGCSRQRQ